MGIPFRSQILQTLVVPPIEATSNQPAATQDVNGSIDSAQRSCGDCHACCIHLPVPAGEVCRNAKPAGVECPHLLEHGCQIYPKRPTTCRQFNCVWLTEPSWPLAWRPEQSGLLCLREKIDGGVSAALVYEIQQGSLARPTTEAVLAKLKDSTAIVALVNLQRQRQVLRGRQWMGPGEHAVRRPHFLKPIHAVGTHTLGALRDAS